MPTKSSRDALERRASIALLRPLGWESLAKNAAAKTAPYGTRGQSGGVRDESSTDSRYFQIFPFLTFDRRGSRPKLRLPEVKDRSALPRLL